MGGLEKIIPAVSDAVTANGVSVVLQISIVFAGIFGAYLFFKYLSAGLKEAHKTSRDVLQGQIDDLKEKIVSLEARCARCDEEKRELKAAYDSQEYRISEAVRRAEVFAKAFELYGPPAGRDISSD